MRRLPALLALSLVMLLGLAAAAIAQEQFLDGKVRTGDSVTVPEGEVVEGDLYAFAGQVVVAGRVTGDVFAFGGSVQVPGQVEGDVFAGAGTVDVNGTVDGDLRMAGGQLSVAGAIGEDLLAGAGQLNVSGTIGEDVVFGAGTASLSGAVEGDVLGRSGTYDRTGSVAGTEDVEIEEPRETEAPNPVVRALSRFASLLLVGLGLLWLGRRLLEGAIQDLDAAPGRAALWGLVLLIALVVAPIGVTIIGLLLAILLGWLGLGLLVGLVISLIVLTWVVAFIAGFILVAILAPIVVATWIADRLLPEESPAWVAMSVGLAVLVGLGLIPYVGPLIGLAVSLLGGGAWLRRLLGRSVGEDTAVPA